MRNFYKFVLLNRCVFKNRKKVKKRAEKPKSLLMIYTLVTLIFDLLNLSIFPNANSLFENYVE